MQASKMLIMFILAFSVSGFGCSPMQHCKYSQNDKIASSEEELVGTWRLDCIHAGTKDQDIDIKRPFFIRFFRGGTLATWPTPWGTVSRGQFTVNAGLFYLPETDHRGTQIHISDQGLWYANEDGDACYYHRVRPDVEPGFNEAGNRIVHAGPTDR